MSHERRTSRILNAPPSSDLPRRARLRVSRVPNVGRDVILHMLHSNFQTSRVIYNSLPTYHLAITTAAALLHRTTISSTHHRPNNTTMSSNDATSTPQSYMDKATGAVQSAVGSLTGSTADKVSLFIPSPRSRLLTHPGPRRKPQRCRRR